MKKILKIFLVFLSVIIWDMSVSAAPENGAEDAELESIYQETQDAILEKIDFSEIDESISELLPGEKIKFRDVMAALLEGEWKTTGNILLRFLKDQLFYEFRANKQNLIHILLIAVVAAVFSNFSSVVQSRQISEIGFYILYVLLITLCLNTFRIAIAGIEEDLQNILNFMTVFCPGYFLAMAVAVGSSSAIWFYNLVLLLIFLSEMLMLRFLIPVIHVYIIVQVMNHMFPEDFLGKMAELLKRFVGWFLKSALGIVVGINIVQGLIAPSIDLVKRSTVTKTIESLPGIGNIFGSAADVVLGTAVLLKNGIGMAGAVILLLICAVPIIQMALLVLFYQLTAALVQPVSDKRITECISSVGEGYELMMRVLLTILLLFLLTIAIAAASTS
ncbi:MAG: stage III sporulation protein AE [Schaedlerella sp.]|nr:stage III sporulation protein AE [Schaedlerella sp.]